MMAKELVMSKYDSIEVYIADILWYVLVLYTVYNENMYVRGGGLWVCPEPSKTVIRPWLNERILLFKAEWYLYVPPALTISNSTFYIYVFCMILNVNSDHFLKRH
jgi:hypothetical protein